MWCVLDINECSPTDGTASPCVDTATCKNERGSYKCVCPEGYHGNGKSAGSGCENDNECVEASSRLLDLVGLVLKLIIKVQHIVS